MPFQFSGVRIDGKDIPPLGEDEYRRLDYSFRPEDFGPIKWHGGGAHQSQALEGVARVEPHYPRIFGNHHGLEEQDNPEPERTQFMIGEKSRIPEPLPDYPGPEMIKWLDGLPDPNDREGPFEAMDATIEHKRMREQSVQYLKHLQAGDDDDDDDGNPRKKRARFSIHGLFGGRGHSNNVGQHQQEAFQQVPQFLNPVPDPGPRQQPPAFHTAPATDFQILPHARPQTPAGQIYHTEEYLYPESRARSDVADDDTVIHYHCQDPDNSKKRKYGIMMKQQQQHEQQGGGYEKTGSKIKRKFAQACRGVLHQVEGHLIGFRNVNVNTYPHETVLKEGSMRFGFFGESGCGKTSLLQRHCKGWGPNRWEMYVPTNLEFYNCDVEVDGVTTHVESWDTSGDPHRGQLKNLTYLYFDVIFVCFNVQSEGNLLPVIAKWVPEAQKIYRKVPIIILGTKTDLRPNPLRMAGQPFHPDTPIHGITPGAGSRLANELGCAGYLECSALDNTGIANTFREAAALVLHERIAEQRKKVEAEVKKRVKRESGLLFR